MSPVFAELVDRPLEWVDNPARFDTQRKPSSAFTWFRTVGTRASDAYGKTFMAPEPLLIVLPEPRRIFSTKQFWIIKAGIALVRLRKHESNRSIGPASLGVIVELAFLRRFHSK